MRERLLEIAAIVDQNCIARRRRYRAAPAFPALLLLAGIGITAATALPHRFEVAPGKPALLYIGADGAIQF